MNRLRQRADFLLGFVGDAAAEPGFREQKCDSFDAAQRRQVLAAPGPPELRIVMRIEKSRELPHMKHAHVSTQQMPRQMQRSVAEPIDWVELAAATAFPEF